MSEFDNSEDTLISDDLEAALAVQENVGDVPQEAPAPDVPEKYRGKEVSDLIDMHRNLESTLGRQSNELGELRRMNEQLSTLIQNQQTTSEPTTIEEDDDVDWYSNPKSQVEKIVNKRMEKYEQELVRTRQENAVKFLQEQHPDIETVLTDNRFNEYLRENPMRLKMFEAARQSTDAESINYFLNEYKSNISSQQSSTTAQVNSAVGETGGAATASTSQPKIRRSQIQHLRASDPARYEALQGSIRQAYMEGRVIND